MEMKKQILNEKGFTLIEVISVVTISTLLILISAVGLSVYFAKYKELNTWVELQKDALACINTIKTGVSVGDPVNGEFYGVANAKRLEIMGGIFNADSGSGITCYPPIADVSQNIDRAQFYFDGRAIRVNYVYKGVALAAPKYLFPEEGALDRIEITNFKVTRLNQSIETIVIQVDLSARTEIREGIFKEVNFSTIMGRD
jgi:prepilin-type N-terminal cleavage/methylation domain-containing protein